MRSTAFPAALAVSLLLGVGTVSAQERTPPNPPTTGSQATQESDQSALRARQNTEAGRRDVSPGESGAPNDAASGKIPAPPDPGAPEQTQSMPHE